MFGKTVFDSGGEVTAVNSVVGGALTVGDKIDIVGAVVTLAQVVNEGNVEPRLDVANKGFTIDGKEKVETAVVAVTVEEGRIEGNEVVAAI